MRENTERWKVLSEQAAIEQDPARLLELVTETNRLLRETQDRISSPLPAEDQNKVVPIA
jgi:hypothetical protein